MADAPPTEHPYDRVPYESLAYPLSHPQRVAAVAVLRGLAPPDVRTCRVLELGCGSGGNLIPMAEQLPGGTFVGIDSAGSAIALAQRDALDAGLANVRF